MPVSAEIQSKNHNILPEKSTLPGNLEEMKVNQKQLSDHCLAFIPLLNKATYFWMMSYSLLFFLIFANFVQL